MNAPFPTCERFGLHPCDFNEQIAVLAARMAAELELSDKVAALAAWAYLHRLNWPGYGLQDMDDRLTAAPAMVAVRRWAEAQAQKRAA